MSAIEHDEISFDYRDSLSADVIERIVYRANELGLSKKKITGIRIKGKFGEGMTVRFNLADYTSIPA